jgi:Spherulation-specific family 4
MHCSAQKVALIAAPAAIISLSLAAAPAQAAAESIVTTLYAYPTLPSWGQVEAAAPTVRAAIVDICAPDGSGSGCNGQPADTENTVWPPTIQALQAAGVTPLYYLWTDYGATPLATVESELQNAINWYGVASPMFDGTSPSASEASYYQSLYNYAIAAGAKTVMFNPGTVVPQSYMFGPNEILQMFEGTQAQFQAASFPSWMAEYPPSEFSATISAGTSAGLATVISDAEEDGIGNIYINDEAEPPNYSTLPAFWSTEVQDVAGTATAQGSQTITFPTPGPGTVGQTATLTATGGASGNPVVFSVDPSSGAGVCAVSGTNGSTLTYQAPGTCAVDANQAAGNGYTAAPQVQQTITVTADTATQLAFTIQAGGGATGAAWSAQPVVSVEDASGKVVAGNTSAVTLAIAAQPGSGAALSCNSNPVTTSAGVASFSGCRITGKAGSYTLTATDGSLTPATSSPVSITAGPAAQLAFTTQPGGGANRAAWSTQPAVAVEDSGGNVVTGGTSSVTLAIAAQPGSGAALSCNSNPVTTSAGVASFSGCKITGKAGSYTLKATARNLSSATSSTFAVTAGPAAQLVFTAQPAGGASGSALSPQPAVAVEDSYGNVVTGSTAAVALAIASQPGNGATLSCTANPATASAGVASFAGCVITGPSGGYTLRATSSGLTTTTSNRFRVSGGSSSSSLADVLAHLASG